MRSVVLWVAGFLLACAWAQAQPRTLGEIPFEYREGLIWLRVSVPQWAEPLHFLLDSGAAVSVLDKETARRLGAKLGERVSVRGVGTRTTGRIARGVTGRVGAMPLPEPLLVVDLGKLSAACQRPIDGLLGADFFSGRVLQIDYAAQTLRILCGAPGGRALPLRIHRGALCVPIRVNGHAPRWVRLDTGCAKPLHWVRSQAPSAACERQVSIGLAAVSVPSAHVSVQLGEERFEAVPAGLHAREIFPGEAGLLGNGLLSRFVVTVDCVGGRVILDKSRGRVSTNENKQEDE